MDAYRAVVTKKDVRALAPDPVTEESLRRILQAGRMAGSSKNSQPCRFVVIRDPERRKRLSECGAFAGWIHSAPVCIAVVLLPGGGPFDAGRAAQNMMVVANAEGLGSCPVTVGDEALELLGIPDGRRVATVLAVGRLSPDAETAGRNRRTRLPLEEFVHLERWRP